MTAANGNGSTPAIELCNLHRHFGRLRAVDGVSFKAYPGQVMGFIGPNGAGKTTAMRILATLDVPTSGEAFINGYSVVDDPDKVRRIVGFMPDSFGKYANMDVVEYVDFFARAYGLSGGDRQDAVERVLVFTELRKLANKPIKTLSKGMSQRLALGRTLIHDPSVLVLDEPAAGLDPRARIELREMIHRLAIDLQKTVLISSHILTELGEILRLGRDHRGGAPAGQRNHGGNQSGATCLRRPLGRIGHFGPRAPRRRAAGTPPVPGALRAERRTQRACRHVRVHGR